MARSRIIKPGFFTNDILAEVPLAGRLLFAGLWTIADREGRLEERPKRIKAEILPYDDCDIGALLAALAQHGFIVRYTVKGVAYIQVTGWKHQSPHVNEAQSVIPAPEEHDTSTIQVPEPSELSITDSIYTSNSNSIDTSTAVDGAKKSHTSTRAVPIPPDFHLSYELVEWGIHEKYDLVLDLDKETAEFIDYWTIGEGQGKRKKNWELTWKARIRERAERVSKIRPFVQKAGNGTKASINDPEVRAKLLPGGKYSFLFDKGEKT